MEKKYTIQNYVIFSLVMKRKNIAKKCLERILGIKIKELKYIESEKTEKLSPDVHGIRMDVYCENDDTVYNIEMQGYSISDIGKRSRYYQDVMDMSILEEGKTYSELKRNIVIFICTFDPYRKGRHIYTFENRCIQDQDICFSDETQKIILNTKGKIDDIPKNLKTFLEYVDKGVIQDEYTKEIDEAVVEIQNDDRWRENIMTVDQWIKDAANDAAARAAEESFQKSKCETAIRMINHGEFSDELICEIADITPEELEDIKNSLAIEG